jgi:hypothetical protein
VLEKEFVQVGAAFKLGFQVGVFKLGCSSWGVNHNFTDQWLSIRDSPQLN